MEVVINISLLKITSRSRILSNTFSYELYFIKDQSSLTVADKKDFNNNEFYIHK